MTESRPEKYGEPLEVAKVTALVAGVRSVSTTHWIGDPPPAFAEMKALDKRLRDGA